MWKWGKSESFLQHLESSHDPIIQEGILNSPQPRFYTWLCGTLTWNLHAGIHTPDPFFQFSYTNKFFVTFVNKHNLYTGSRSSRVVCALSRAQLQDGYVSYPWEKKMKEILPVCNLSCFLSILLLPKASDPTASRYNDQEDTLTRANAWLHASQASGVPIVFMSVQTEALLTKVNKLLLH